MQLDDETKERIRELVVGYTDLLSRLVRETKPQKGERSELHEHYFNQFAELLCLRDEHTTLMRNELNSNANSVLDTPALRNYEELYAFLASDTEYPPPMLKPSDDEPLRLCDATVSICRRGLHRFGTRNTGGEDIEALAWERICDTFFPSADTIALRRAYYNHVSSSAYISAAGLPERWSLKEDYTIFEHVSRYGRGETGVQHIYSSLCYKRSHDEIIERIHVIYPKKTRVYKTKKRKCVDTKSTSSETDSNSPQSDWSIDDSLLLVRE